MEGVWESAAACMRNYLLLRSRTQAFRADPEVQAALVAARLDELAQTTLAPGETLASMRSQTFDADASAARGMAFERLDQLALDYLFGMRS
jgi:xylose isomerase